MTCNVGKTDRTVRIIVGIVIVVIGIVSKSWWGLIGLVPIATALAGWCPLYVPFKISTVKKEKTPPSGAEG